MKRDVPGTEENHSPRGSYLYNPPLPQRSLCLVCFVSPLVFSAAYHQSCRSPTVSAVLNQPTNIRFLPDLPDADLSGLILDENPRKTRDGFVWLFPIRRRLSSRSSGRLDIAESEGGFAIRFLNKTLPEDASFPKQLSEHNQATLDYLFRVQGGADSHMNEGEFSPS